MHLLFDAHEGFPLSDFNLIHVDKLLFDALSDKISMKNTHHIHTITETESILLQVTTVYHKSPGQEKDGSSNIVIGSVFLK